MLVRAVVAQCIQGNAEVTPSCTTALCNELGSGGRGFPIRFGSDRGEGTKIVCVKRALAIIASQEFHCDEVADDRHREREIRNNGQWFGGRNNL